MKKALSYLLIFIGLQIVGGGIITTLWNMIAGNSDETAAKLITTTAVVGIITIVIFLWTRYVAHTSLDGTYLERRGSNGSHHTLHVDTGANARTAQLCRTGV